MIWSDIEPGVQSDQGYPAAKRLNTPLRHGELPREEDAAIKFWRLKYFLRNEFETRNPIDPALQDNVLNFFEYIYHVGCAVSLHSITDSWLIAGGQNSSKEGQTAVNPMDKDHNDPRVFDLTKPRFASYKQKKWTRHQDTVLLVDFQLVSNKM